MTAEMSNCDTPEKPFAFENQYNSINLKVFFPRDKLQIRGLKTQSYRAFFFQICIQQYSNLLI